MLNILVAGAGAIGCFVGGRLAVTGHHVTLLGRPALMNKIGTDGLTLHHPTLPSQIVFPQTVTTLNRLSTTYDFILVTVKSPDTPQITAELMASRLPLTKSYIVSFQNGIGNEEKLAASFGSEQVIAGTITIPISMPEQGVIEVSKDKGGLGLARLQPSQPVQILAGALNQAGLTTETYDNYQAMKWSKLLLNIANNASSAILDQLPTQVIDRTDLFNLEIEALSEAVAVMKAQGLNPVKLPGYPTDWLARLLVARWLPIIFKRAILRPSMRSGRGSKMPSLQIDLAAGRSTSEVEVLNGAIARVGQQLGIATPVNQALTDILSGLAGGRLDRADFRHQPEKLLQAVAVRRNF